MLSIKRILVCSFFVWSTMAFGVTSQEPLNASAITEAEVEKTSGLEEQRVRRFALGLGLQARIESEVNPAYYNTRALGQFFLRYHDNNWSGLLEVGEDQKKSGSGNYSISNQIWSLGLWGRYEPWVESRWSIFFSGGVGVNLETIETTLGEQSKTARGTRTFVGLGAGIMRTIFERGLVELELRVISEEQRSDSALAGLLRLGYQL